MWAFQEDNARVFWIHQVAGDSTELAENLVAILQLLRDATIITMLLNRSESRAWYILRASSNFTARLSQPRGMTI